MHRPVFAAIVGLCSAFTFTMVSGQCEIAEIAGSAASLKDGTGWSVAVDGATGVAGSPLDDPLGTDSGSAYVLERQGASWVETAFLVPADGAAEDEFGSAVAVDGDIIVVGAPLDDDWGFDSGSVYVFERTPMGWTEAAKLNASDASPFDEFGNAVAIDGSTCVIGTGYAGNAYVFELQGGVWVETAKLVTGLVWSWGPVSVDGDVVALGTPDLAGAAHVFEKEGGTWGLTATLLPSGTPGVDHFGRSLSVSGDRILIGASSDDDAAHSAGAAYLFEKQGRTWIEAVKLYASDPHQNAGFGRSVVLNGGDAAIGASAANGKGGMTRSCG